MLGLPRISLSIIDAMVSHFGDLGDTFMVAPSLGHFSNVGPETLLVLPLILRVVASRPMVDTPMAPTPAPLLSQPRDGEHGKLVTDGPSWDEEVTRAICDGMEVVEAQGRRTRGGILGVDGVGVVVAVFGGFGGEGVSFNFFSSCMTGPFPPPDPPPPDPDPPSLSSGTGLCFKFAAMTVNGVVVSAGDGVVSRTSSAICFPRTDIFAEEGVPGVP